MTRTAAAACTVVLVICWIASGRIVLVYFGPPMCVVVRFGYVSAWKYHPTDLDGLTLQPHHRWRFDWDLVHIPLSLTQAHGFTLQFWMIVPLPLVIWLFAWWRDIRAERSGIHACVHCKYDQAGLDEKRPCPECGRANQH
jgi:hypothetical protein